MSFSIHIDGSCFRDDHSREIVLHGINLAGDAKNPRHPDIPSHVADGFFDGDNVSFVGRPFDLSDAPTHFARLRQWGYNTLRYVFTWEALEHAGPKKYDEDFIQHTISVLRCAKDFGFLVFMDPHQDTWSRFTGGCGAPMWTLYACGLDPEAFGETGAALVQNTSPDPSKFPKMIWATNYYRLACQVMFTCFFAGKQYTPLAIIDGVNIQEYLQSHLVNACQHFALRIKEADDLQGRCVIGWENLNEPNRGIVGYPDITIIPDSQVLKLGASPTAWQAMLLGSGRACQVETWSLGGMGPYKSGTERMDPKGKRAWLSPDYDDTKYGWKRDPKWKLGEDIWAQHGVWDPRTNELLRKDYFAKDPRTGKDVDYEYFTNTFFFDFYKKYRNAIREVWPESMMICQPPTLELPPTIKGTEDDDPNMIYAPHWYDGLTLMNKHWNRYWNVDVLGVLRGRYWHPAFAIKIGETAIKNCFKNEMLAMQKEGLDYMGLHPFIMGETGVPYDLDDSYAYKTGDYTNQLLAMDANAYALERSKSNFTLWNYTATNCHQYGDLWNGEDLSIFSVDDRELPRVPVDEQGSTSLSPTSPSYSRSLASGAKSTRAPTADSMSTSGKLLVKTADDYPPESFRAAQAFVRPYPIATHGDIIEYGFDIRTVEFTLKIFAPSSTSEDAPTEVFLPEFHFPANFTDVEVSVGKFQVDIEEPPAGYRVQVLRWWHAQGEQNITVRGKARAKGLPQANKGESSGIIRTLMEQCRECNVM